jgi:hypothetical protein
VNERVDFDRVMTFERNSVEFVIIYRDKGVLRVLVSVPLVGAFDGLSRDLVDQLLPQPVAGLLVDLAK